MKNLVYLLIMALFLANQAQAKTEKVQSGDNNIQVNININGNQGVLPDYRTYPSPLIPVYEPWYIKPSFLQDDNCCHTGVFVNGCTCPGKYNYYIQKGFN